MSDPTLALVTDAAALHARRWATGFRDRGWRVRLLSWGGQSPLEGIDIIPILDARPRPGRGPWATLTGYRALRRELAAADVVHVHSIPGGRWVTCLTGLRHLMITSWGSDALPRQGQLRANQRRWVRHALRQAQAVGFLSRYAGRELATHYGLAASKLHWTPFGVDLAQFDPARFPAPADTPFTIGFFKHLLPLYGPDVLLDALQGFGARYDAPWQARLYGDGASRDALDQQIDRLRLREQVTLHGRVAHEALPAAMRACHVVVSPSVVEESLGLASIEAQAMGIAVINSDIGGMPETCVPGESGLLVSPGDSAALATALLRLATDPAERQRMGAHGQQFVRDAGYEWNACLDRADAIQRGLLARSR